MKRFITILLSILFLNIFSETKVKAQYDVGVFYMPFWYYNTNSDPLTGNWGMINDYNNFVNSAGRPDLGKKPMNIYQPNSQWYDDKLPAVNEKQFDLMSKAGINFAIYDAFFWGDNANNWNMYWNEALENNKNNAFNNHGVKFALMWANDFAKLVNGRCSEFFNGGGLDYIANKWIEYFNSSNYKTIDGKPVVYIYYPNVAATYPYGPYADNIEGMCGMCESDPFFSSVGANEPYIQSKKTNFLLNKLKQKVGRDIYFVAVIAPPIRKWNEPNGNDWSYKWAWLITHPQDAGYNALTSYGYSFFEYNDAFDDISQTPSCNGNPGSQRWTYDYNRMQYVHTRFYDYILSNSSIDYQIPATAGFNQGAGALSQLNNGNLGNWDLSNIGACNYYATSSRDLGVSDPFQFENHLQTAKNYADWYPTRTRKTIVLSAWNEYAEGNVIEPTEFHGYQYVNAIRSTFSPWLPYISSSKPKEVIPTGESSNSPSGNSGFSFNIVPNPVKTSININIINNNNPHLSFYLYDMQSHSLIKSWENKPKQAHYTFDIKGIQGGQYILEMAGGKQKNAKQVIIVD